MPVALLHLNFLKTKIPHQILTKKINKRKKKPKFVLLLNPLFVPLSLPKPKPHTSTNAFEAQKFKDKIVP